MKKPRLDEILLRNGAVNEEQILRALLRQKSRGGRLGTHLLYYRFISEDALVEALAEQIHRNGIRLGDLEIPEDVARMIPPDVAERHVAIPFRYDRENGELHVAASDPDDPALLPALRRASGVPRIVPFIAPEAAIRGKIARHHHGASPAEAVRQVIDLPDLFEAEKAAAEAAFVPSTGGAPAVRRLVLLTRQLFLKSALPSVLEREGMSLLVACGPAEAADLLRAERFDRLLVTEDARADLEALAASGTPLPETSFFRTVGEAVVENPAPYARMAESLLSAVRVLAERRTDALPSPPPYALIAGEAAELAHAMGISRLGADGLRIAAWLLLPGGADSPPGCPGSLADSAALADRLGHPWDIGGCLREIAAALVPPAREPGIAAGILALSWYRHHALRGLRARTPADADALRSALRAQAGRLAPSSVVEAYLRFVEQTADAAPAGEKDLFLVGEIDAEAPGLAVELRHHGYRIVHASGLAEAAAAYARRRPAAILVRVDDSLAAADDFCRSIRREGRDEATVLFAVTRRTEPSFLLNLLETWFNDVLPLPLNAAVAVARVSKAVSDRERGGETAPRQGFSASFQDLSFVDLVQTLGAGQKSVRMRVEHGKAVAELYFRRGRIAHAACADRIGAEAVFEVIRWKDEGHFRIEPAETFPPDNVPQPTDYLLLEGLRRLDEALRDA